MGNTGYQPCSQGLKQISENESIWFIWSLVSSDSGAIPSIHGWLSNAIPRGCNVAIFSNCVTMVHNPSTRTQPLKFCQVVKKSPWSSYQCLPWLAIPQKLSSTISMVIRRVLEWSPQSWLVHGAQCGGPYTALALRKDTAVVGPPQTSYKNSIRILCN